MESEGANVVAKLLKKHDEEVFLHINALSSSNADDFESGLGVSSFFAHWAGRVRRTMFAGLLSADVVLRVWDRSSRPILTSQRMWRVLSCYGCGGSRCSALLFRS